MEVYVYLILIPNFFTILFRITVFQYGYERIHVTFSYLQLNIIHLLKILIVLLKKNCVVSCFLYYKCLMFRQSKVIYACGWTARQVKKII